jgi:two-component system LytT family response regulator
MKILIIEDEKNSATRLARQLGQINMDIIMDGPLTSIVECKEYFSTQDLPDAIISDIRLIDGLSFEALALMPKFIPVIFLTAYDEYAIEAFNFNGISYLLKPVSTEKLSDAVGKIDKIRSSMTQDTLLNLAEQMSNRHRKWKERFLLHYRDTLISISYEDISLITTLGKETSIYCNDGTMHTYKATLDKLESELNPKYFFRTSRSHIVNINQINKISLLSPRKLKVSVKGYPEEFVTVSKDRISMFKQWLGDL